MEGGKATSGRPRREGRLPGIHFSRDTHQFHDFGINWPAKPNLLTGLVLFTLAPSCFGGVVLGWVRVVETDTAYELQNYRKVGILACQNLSPAGRWNLGFLKVLSTLIIFPKALVCCQPMSTHHKLILLPVILLGIAKMYLVIYNLQSNIQIYHFISHTRPGQLLFRAGARCPGFLPSRFMSGRERRIPSLSSGVETGGMQRDLVGRRPSVESWHLQLLVLWPQANYPNFTKALLYIFLKHLK